MASIKDLISSLKKTKDKAISDNEGWFRGGKFTPGRQIVDSYKQSPGFTVGPAFIPNLTNEKVRNVYSSVNTPEKQAKFNEAPVKNFAQGLNSFAMNNYVAPMTQVPYNLKEAFGGEQKPLIQRGIHGLSAVGGMMPGIDDTAYAIWNTAKGIKAEQLRGADKLSSYKEGLNYLMGRKQAGLGDALSTNPTAQTVGNIAEIPLTIFMAGRLNSKNADEVADLVAKRSKLVKLADETPDAKNVTKAIAGIDSRLANFNIKVSKTGKIKIINPSASGDVTEPKIKIKPPIKTGEVSTPEVKTGEGGKIFYHGTKADFDKFDDTKLGSNTEWLNSKWGHFFSDDKNIAKRFLDEDSVQLKDTRTGRIIEAELDIKKPLDFTPEGLTTKKEQAQIIYEGMTGKKVSPEKALGYLKDAYDEAINSGGITDFYDELYSTLKIKELAKQKGYDGIISHYGELDGKKIKEYGVFSSNQIKIKPPIKTGEVSKLENELLSEAKKYKSADEFVKAQGGNKLYNTGDSFEMGKIIDNPFKEGVPSVEKAQEINKYLQANKDKYNPKFVKFYHGTAKGLPIEEKGLLPTSATRRKSYQSESGYVYLANTPERAKTFGDLGNMSKSDVYEVVVPVDKLMADLDQLNNIRLTGEKVGNTVGESIVYGGGVRIKGKIEPYAIRKLPDDFKTKSQLTDIWNKANKNNADDALINEARKYKSADEFVKAQETRTGVEVRDKIGTKLQDPYTAEYLPTNPDGTITIYHSTTKEGAEKIKQSGIFGSKTEDGNIYFTTNKKGYGGIGKDKDVVLAFNVDPNKVKFDDVYRGELHLKGNNADIGGIKPIKIKPNEDLVTKFDETIKIKPSKKIKEYGVFSSNQIKIKPPIKTGGVSTPEVKGVIPEGKGIFDSTKIGNAYKDGNQLYVKDILTNNSPEVYKKVGDIPINFTLSNEKSVAGQPFTARLVIDPQTGRQVIEVNKFFPYKNDLPAVLDKTLSHEVEHALNYRGNPEMFNNTYQGGNLNKYQNEPVEKVANANLNKRVSPSIPSVKQPTIKITKAGENMPQAVIKIRPEPYIDAQGELQFPGGPKKIEPFAKPDLDISDEAKGTASIIGGSSGIKASPEVKEYFANWTNARRASQVEGILKSREFTDLDSKGIEGILEFQAGNKTGRFSDVKNYFDNKFTQAKNEGLKLNYKQDYLPQMWLNPKGEVEAVFGNRLGLNPSFTFESIMKNYQEGIEAGLTPRFSKLSDLIGSYESRVNKSLADRKFFIRLKEDNLILPQSKAPTDWVTLDPDRFPRLSFTTDQGKYTGIYKAPEDLAKMINNYLADPSTSPNVVLKGLNTIANWTSSVKNRVLSFGVPGTAVNAHGFNILARNVMASKNPIEGAVTGIKYMLHPESAAKYLDSELIKAPDAVKHGLTLSANEFKSVLEEPQGFKTKFGDTWYKLFEKGLFDRMLPALKLQKYQEVVDGFIKSGMDETLAKRNAAKFTNDVFGGINWEEFGKSRDWQNIKRMFLLAPDWIETNINLAKKTAKSTVNFSDKSLSAYRRFLATFLGSYVTMNVVNKLSSGHWMYQNDSGNTFNIEAGYTSDGQKRYIRPFGTAADFIRIPYDVANSLSQGDLQAPARVVRNRLSIPAGVGLGVFFDTDYTGQPIGWKGTDKYGGEMPAKQRLMGVGGELATLAGFPAFMKQGLDYTSGKTGLEQSLLQGLELPFRYSGGAYNKTQQKISDILKEQGASGEELYNANKGIKGLTFSDKDIQKIKVGGLDKFNEIQQSKENSAELKSKLKGEGYYTSKDAPKNLIEKTIVGTQALVTDPKQLVRAIFTKERLRKVENGFVVLERKEGLGQLDTEDKSTQIDHIVPLEFGGTNPTKSNEKILEETKGMTLEQRNAYLKKYNLEALDTQEHDLKTKYQNYLSAELKAKRMTKKEVTTKMANWKEEILKLPENVMGKIVKDALATDTKTEVKTSGKIYTIKTTKTDSEGVETTTSKDYDIYSPIEEPKYTGQTEVDKLKKAEYKSALTKRIKDIYTVQESGQIPADEAEKLIAEIKQLQGKSGTSKSSKVKIGTTPTFKSSTVKIKSSIPKVSIRSPNIKISMPKTSQKKIALPKFKKQNLANRTVRVKQFRQPVIRVKTS